MPDALWPLYPWMHLVGRILFGMLFIGSGMSHLVQRRAMVDYARTRGAPVPEVGVPVTGLMILVGGAFVMVGWHRFIGAGLLVIALLLFAFTMHAFWRDTDPAVRQNEMGHFMKDLALAGAALLIAYYGGYGWPMSLGG